MKLPTVILNKYLFNKAIYLLKVNVIIIFCVKLKSFLTFQKNDINYFILTRWRQWLFMQIRREKWGKTYMTFSVLTCLFG